VRIATWNVNSLRVRMAHLGRWLAEHAVDAIALQELKLADEHFPRADFEGMGLRAASYGQKTYNGVAVLVATSRSARLDVRAKDLPGDAADEQRRFLHVGLDDLDVVDVYVPNGSSVGSDKYAYKLRWMQRLGDYLRESCEAARPLLVCGDFNVAPEDRDLWSPKAFVGATHVTEPERAAVARLRAWGLVDAFRQCYADDRLFTYWDYRRGDFHEHRGMRIDLALVTEPLAARISWAAVDRNARKGKQPSDHAPLLVDFA